MPPSSLRAVALSMASDSGESSPSFSAIEAAIASEDMHCDTTLLINSMSTGLRVGE